MNDSTLRGITLLPFDEFNQALIEHVHPPGWINPSPGSRPYDLVVIGAGTAGLITAIGAAGLGKRVALIERYLMGGDCLNVGCVPSKALIRAGAAAAEMRDGGRFGVHARGIEVDFDAVMRRLRATRAAIAPHDSAARYRAQGIDVYLGQASFVRSGVIEVNGTQLRFRKACIATGARASAPPIAGLHDVDYLTNETLFELTALPRRLGIIGAGPIGCEMAQAFARLGSAVQLLETRHGVLPAEVPEAGAVVRRALMRDGVRVHCCAREMSVATGINGGIRLNIASHDVNTSIEVDALLVAAGRAPNVESLNLGVVGVEADATGVRVDPWLRTTNSDIFAAGDVCSRYKFTHAADALARIVVRNAMLPWLPFKPRADRLVMPWCTYTDPEVAHVGATAESLTSDGTPFATTTIELADNDRARLEDDTHGFLTVHTANSGHILGATLVSRHAGESIGELTTAMTHGIRLRDLARVIHPYPTQAEVIKRAADAAYRNHLLALRDRLLPWRTTNAARP